MRNLLMNILFILQSILEEMLYDVDDSNHHAADSQRAGREQL